MIILDYLLYHIGYVFGLKVLKEGYYKTSALLSVFLTFNIQSIINFIKKGNIIMQNEVYGIALVLSIYFILAMYYIRFNHLNNLSEKFNTVKEYNLVLTYCYMIVSFTLFVFSLYLVKKTGHNMPA